MQSPGIRHPCLQMKSYLKMVPKRAKAGDNLEKVKDRVVTTTKMVRMVMRR